MSKKIAYSGILLAVDILLFVMLNVFQTNTIFILGLASLPIAIIIMNWGPKTGAIFYIASVILGFMVINNKAHWIIYVFTFGVYGLIKYLIEQERPIYVEYILKLVYANIALAIVYFIVRQFVYVPEQWYLILLFEVVFLVYDYAYSLFIDYYNQRLKNMINR
ncbi:MAG: hypothetical protein MR593_13370 [Intestinibacter sp.]|uniref:hypothetical protein n=1 Tax=Intestinibacter sp. TaxID=1965304 RepID=UPI0025C2B439|nr:hypothetical protein [Intestinibacter sp.]MCI6739096.1 hypothetical protein [Intestinibacter sp.]